MTLISLLITIVIIGVLLWLITLIPMEPTMKKIAIGLAIVIVILWLLSSFGLLTGVGNVGVAPLRTH